jgi:hypothetical protein
MNDCRLCQNEGIHCWLEFGAQALRNRFLRSADEEEFTHPLKLGVCRHCGIVQLASPPPVEELRPRFEWISYNEPERHLDNLAAKLTKLHGITTRSTFAGLTYKDDSTLARLNRLGFASTWRPNPQADLGIESRFAGIESIQERLTLALAGALSDKFGRPDVLIVRHVLEHTHNTLAALEWARNLVRPGGYIAFEVPDTLRAFDLLDYTTIWEEHALYFTTSTLQRCLELAGFEVVALESYPYTLENSLVAIIRSVVSEERPSSPVKPAELARAERFINEFQRVRERVHSQLKDWDRIAMFGAGHHTGAFINLFGLADRIAFIADDNPKKQGLFMPGSRLPILPSTGLLTREIDLCLMTVRPEIEEAVVGKNTAFSARGGVLASVFPNSPYVYDRVGRLAEVQA